jgi:hypothetical protein
MAKLLIISLLSVLIVTGLTSLGILQREEKLVEKPFTASRKITAEQGAIGCLYESSLREINLYFTQKKSDETQNMIARGLCVYFSKGQELLAHDDACKAGKVFISIPQGKSSEFYLPCSAIK